MLEGNGGKDVLTGERGEDLLGRNKDKDRLVNGGFTAL
jgi:hypothetical protein